MNSNIMDQFIIWGKQRISKNAQSAVKLESSNRKVIKMDYTKSIEAWAKNRGLYKTNSDKQLIKLIEEVGELSEAHNKGYRDKQIDSIGDIFVVLTIYALQNDLHLDDCVKEAYDTIKDRDGKMIDGVFVKNSDLEETNEN